MVQQLPRLCQSMTVHGMILLKDTSPRTQAVFLLLLFVLLHAGRELAVTTVISVSVLWCFSWNIFS